MIHSFAKNTEFFFGKQLPEEESVISPSGPRRLDWTTECYMERDSVVLNNSGLSLAVLSSMSLVRFQQ